MSETTFRLLALIVTGCVAVWWLITDPLSVLLGVTVAMFTTNDLMLRWGVTRDTVLNFIHTGRLRAINVSRSKGRASWRIPDDAVEIFEQANESPEWNAPPQPKRPRRSQNVTEFF